MNLLQYILLGVVGGLVMRLSPIWIDLVKPPEKGLIISYINIGVGVLMQLVAYIQGIRLVIPIIKNIF